MLPGQAEIYICVNIYAYDSWSQKLRIIIFTDILLTAERIDNESFVD